MPDTSVFLKTTPDKTQGKQASGLKCKVEVTQRTVHGARSEA
jgi:hypothetical protein